MPHARCRPQRTPLNRPHFLIPRSDSSSSSPRVGTLWHVSSLLRSSAPSVSRPGVVYHTHSPPEAPESNCRCTASPGSTPRDQIRKRGASAGSTVPRCVTGGFESRGTGGGGEGICILISIPGPPNSRCGSLPPRFIRFGVSFRSPGAMVQGSVLSRERGARSPGTRVAGPPRRNKRLAFHRRPPILTGKGSVFSGVY